MENGKNIEDTIDNGKMNKRKEKKKNENMNKRKKIKNAENEEKWSK